MRDTTVYEGREGMGEDGEEKKNVEKLMSNRARLPFEARDTNLYAKT